MLQWDSAIRSQAWLKTKAGAKGKACNPTAAIHSTVCITEQLTVKLSMISSILLSQTKGKLFVLLVLFMNSTRWRWNFVGAQLPRNDDMFSAKGRFKETMEKWMKSIHGSTTISWYLWTDFATTMESEFENTPAGSPLSRTKMQKRRLEIVGAIEEGILTIENFLVRQKQPSATDHPMEDIQRDAALADLYVAYGTFLQKLTPIECLKLASDPHTLLIGAPERLEDYKRIMQSDEDSRDELELLRNLFPPLCHDNADNAVRNAMSLDATNEKALVLLEKLTGMDDPMLVHRRKPKEFVAELFDSFAETFDAKLLGSLQYRVPQLIGEAVRNVILPRTEDGSFRAVLDAGCGTGLAGRHLQPMLRKSDPTGILVGVDASSKMLDVASRCTGTTGCAAEKSKNDVSDLENDRPLYDRLLQMDLEDMNLTNTLKGTSIDGFDLIVAADVLVYFGSLERVFGVFASLAPSESHSWLIFSCERATPEEAPLGFRLLPSGRFAHTKDHVFTMAGLAGYSLNAYTEIMPRLENGEPVKGHLFVFETNMQPITSIQDGEL